jgi:hypothetical protein
LPAARPEPPAGEALTARPLPVAPAVASLPATALDSDVRALAGSGQATAGSLTSRWQRTFPMVRYTGDWDCDKSAMPNLAHQFEQRTGSVLPFESRTVGLESPEVREAPFLFMSGHKDFQLSAAEAASLRAYLEAGGSLWINDSTDVADVSFDQAVRRELPKLVPDLEWRHIPMDHPLFRIVYPLSNGFHGYKVPPGDKYRVDYLEGIWIAERLAVVYTRNDYGDGLEIDPRTHPLMPSLTGLTAEEMQESSVQMGINLVTFFLNRGQPPSREVLERLRAAAPPLPQSATPDWTGRPALPLPLLASAADWAMPVDWQGDQLLQATASAVVEQGKEIPDALSIAFETAGKPFQAWYHEAVVKHAWDRPISANEILLVDVVSHLPGGARIALGFGGAGPVPYVETAPVFVLPGSTRGVAFDLRQQTFKTAATGWQTKAPWPPELKPDAVFVVVFPQQGQGTVEIRRFRLVTP